MFKKIISAFLAVAMAATMCTTVFADEQDVAPEAGLTQDDLLEGEKLVGDIIYGRTIIEDTNSPQKARSYGPNYAESREIALFWYEGYIQFVPSYQTTTLDGDGLVPGRFVESAWIDYRRNGVSVVDGGAKWTDHAPSLASSSVYSTSLNATDAPVTWGEAGRTDFYRGWNYFSY